MMVCLVSIKMCIDWFDGVVSDWVLKLSPLVVHQTNPFLWFWFSWFCFFGEFLSLKPCEESAFREYFSLFLDFWLR